jgi:hypothetical protein
MTFNEVFNNLPAGTAVYLVSLIYMTGTIIHTPLTRLVRYIIPDISNAVTWSFPEFVPFCPRLYYFSNFKDFNRLAPAS